jgi:cation:H+ antiporter
MISLVWLAVGGLLLYVGAEGLVRGSVALAYRAGMTPLVVGLTVVAAATSMPELVVSVTGALQGDGAIAVGNVVGSNICNILLIGSLTALIRPIVVQHTVVRREIPIMIAVSVLASVLLFRGGGLTRLEAGLLLALLVGSIAWSLRSASPTAHTVEAREAPVAAPLPVVGGVLLVVGGLALLVVGANRFVLGAVELARVFGLSEAVIALSVVALGTSLPELATSVVAAFKGESDIALGNVVGSNLFNLLGILGVTGLVRPLPLPAGTGADLLVMVGTAVLVLPLARSGFRVQRWEGALLLMGYAAYMVWLFSRGT